MFGIFILWHQWSSNFKLFFILLKTTLQVVLELETSSSEVPRYDCATSAGLSLSISIRTIYLFCLFHPVHEILGRFTLRSWTLESVGSNDWLRHEWRWDEGHDFLRQLSFSFSPFFSLDIFGYVLSLRNGFNSMSSPNGPSNELVWQSGSNSA